MKLVLIGIGPSASKPRLGDGEALTGRSGVRIAQLAGVTFNEYRACTVRFNLLDEYPGSVVRMAEIMVQASRMRFGFAGLRVLLCGMMVAHAFRVAPRPLLQWRHDARLPGAIFAVVPHPSGRNRWWNDEGNERLASRFLSRTFSRRDGAGHGTPAAT